VWSRPVQALLRAGETSLDFLGEDNGDVWSVELDADLRGFDIEVRAVAPEH